MSLLDSMPSVSGPTHNFFFCSLKHSFLKSTCHGGKQTRRSTLRPAFGKHYILLSLDLILSLYLILCPSILTFNMHLWLALDHKHDSHTSDLIALTTDQFFLAVSSSLRSQLAFLRRMLLYLPVVK